MVDIGAKAASERRAIAEGWIYMRAESLQKLQRGAHQKGEVLAVARVAGIMAAKRTAEWIPLCHPIALTYVNVEFAPQTEPAAVHCVVTTATCERTGVEMEALVAVQAALLTIYDMAKSSDRGMVISDVRLVEKRGGKSGQWRRDAQTAA